MQVLLHQQYLFLSTDHGHQGHLAQMEIPIFDQASVALNVCTELKANS